MVFPITFCLKIIVPKLDLKNYSKLRLSFMLSISPLISNKLITKFTVVDNSKKSTGQYSTCLKIIPE